MQDLSKDELDEFLEFCAEKALVSADGGNGSQMTLFLTFCYSAKVDCPWDLVVNRLAEECYPVGPSPQSIEERRTRLASQRTRPLPQLPAQDSIEPALKDCAAFTALRPGESYKIHYAHDVLGSVSEEFTLIVERAARWCGVEDEVIYAVVERFERRFLWWKKRKDKVEKDLVESEDSEEADE